MVVMSITQPLQSYLLVVTCLGCTPYYHYVHFLQVRLFEDFSSGGSLCVIMATAFRVKADQSWYMCNVCVCVCDLSYTCPFSLCLRRRFDFLIPSRMDRGLELFVAIHKDLMQVLGGVLYRAVSCDVIFRARPFYGSHVGVLHCTVLSGCKSTFTVAMEQHRQLSNMADVTDMHRKLRCMKLL